MKKITILFLLIVTSVNAQVTEEWIRTYSGVGSGGNYADKGYVDKLGNFIVGGRSDSTSTDYIILKYNSSGNLLWSRRYDGIAHRDEWFRDMILDDSGNVYVTGSSDEGASNGNVNWATVKYSHDGILRWEKSLDWTFHKQDNPFSITLDNLDNVYVTGYGLAPPSGFQNDDIVIAKYSRDGEELWIRSYNCFKSIGDWGYSVVTDDSCNAYVSGYSKLQQNPSLDVIVTIKYDSEGKQIWVREFQRATPEYAAPLYSRIDKAANVIISGNYDNGYDYVTLKYDREGILIWNRVFNGIGTGLNVLNAIYVDDSLNVYACGRSGNFHNYLSLVKYSPIGDTIFTRFFDNGTGLSNEAFDITGDIFGNIYLAGYTNNVGDDFLTVKYDSQGDLIWSKVYSLPMANSLYGIGVDNYNNVFVTGYKDSLLRSSIVTIKYSQPTCIQNGDNALIEIYDLNNYPNPFNSQTIINYEIPDNGNIKIITYDNLGKEIELLCNKYQEKGKYKISFTANNYSSGIYFYSLITNNKIVKTGRMLLIK